MQKSGRLTCLLQVEEKEMERDQQHQRAMREARMERARHAEEKRAMEAEQVGSCLAARISTAERACTFLRLCSQESDLSA
jgi:hypothetical protein